MELKDKIPKATHEGPLKIGDLVIQCAVLEDGTRVLTQRSVYKAMGRSGSTGGTKQRDDAQGLPRILAAANLNPYISEELRCAIVPFLFNTKRGGTAFAYRAESLPQICNVYLDARQMKVLNASQMKIAAACEVLVRAFAQVGIIALVDEVTGYQYDRDRDDLERFLSLYLTAEHLKWARMFPDEFFRQIYRLKRWPYPRGTSKRTPLIGKIINKIVFAKLPEKVLPKLRELNPVISKTKRRRWKHHQFFSEDIGQPDLREHLVGLMTLQKAAANWRDFERMVERAFPGPGLKQTVIGEIIDV